MLEKLVNNSTSTIQNKINRYIWDNVNGGLVELELHVKLRSTLYAQLYINFNYTCRSSVNAKIDTTKKCIFKTYYKLKLQY